MAGEDTRTTFILLVSARGNSRQHFFDGFGDHVGRLLADSGVFLLLLRIISRRKR